MTKRNRRFIFVGIVFAVSALSVALALTGLSRSVAYFYTPSDLQSLPQVPDGVIRLGGLVAEGSVEFADSDDAAVNFVIRDEMAQTPVSYRGILPDLFREGQGVVVLGTLEDGGLIATEVLAKHDENYMPKEVAEALKKQGRWREGELSDR